MPDLFEDKTSMGQTHVPAELRRLVRERAHQIPESATFSAHEVDHIIAVKHGGETNGDNLALSCIVCNKRKGSDLTSIDSVTGATVPLFHPRKDGWSSHFQLVEGRIEPMTAIGRATVRLLQLKQPDRVEERASLVAAGLIAIPGSVITSSTISCSRKGYRSDRSFTRLRVAVTGKAIGFGLFESLAILGKKQCLARMNRALERL
jgi:hypothetical protein